MRKYCLCLGRPAFGLLALGLASTAQAVDPIGPEGSAALVRAHLRTDSPLVQAGSPVWVEFSLTNLTTDPLTLRVPQATMDESDAGQMGLPLGHVFSGTGFSAVSIEDGHGVMLDSQVSVQPRRPIPLVRLAPRGSVGLRVELTQYYPSLRRPGEYTLLWRPYQGTLEPAAMTLTVLAEKQAVIITDFGEMRIRFYYDQAPNHVQNFIGLVQQGFYDGLTFHRVIPGGIIQGGDPRGDGRGIRPDGKRVKAEFSSIPFDRGTVGMARGKDVDSASCQFYICLARQPEFDGRQTAFGHLVGDASLETLDRIAAAPTGLKDRPRTPIYIRAVSLENVPMRESELAGTTSWPGPTSRPAPAVPGSYRTGSGLGQRQRLDSPGVPGARQRSGTTRPAAGPVG